ncbi:MAG: hypothetical protein IIX53_00030, partial [Phascolarctobacterium sp.]|nr:hypothetical protein [Phascolarctobacterium sp.]
MTNEEEREKEISLISKIICVIVTWAKLNGYNPNDVVKKISGWLGAIDSIASFENFNPSWSCVIRALDDEALAEFIIDSIKEMAESDKASAEFKAAVENFLATAEDSAKNGAATDALVA